VAPEYINNKNLALLNREIWGSDGYLSNSDAVCILKHAGLQFSDLKENEWVRLKCRVSKCKEKKRDCGFIRKMEFFVDKIAKKTYTSAEKNNLVSRRQSTPASNLQTPQSFQWRSLKPERWDFSVHPGSMDSLYYAAKRMKLCPVRRKQSKPINIKKAPVIPEAHITMNMCNEFAYVYNLLNICDKGEDRKNRTATLLNTQSLYLENEYDRFEVCCVKMDTETWTGIFGEIYKLSKLKNPKEKDDLFFSNSPVPLPSDQVDVLLKEFEWKEALWGNQCVKFKDLTISNIKTFKFYANTAV
jgi:hypothetical protein